MNFKFIYGLQRGRDCKSRQNSLVFDLIQVDFLFLNFGQDQFCLRIFGESGLDKNCPRIIETTIFVIPSVSFSQDSNHYANFNFKEKDYI